MTYRRALALLEARSESKIRLGLARMRRHLAALGDPQEASPAVHVAGTNGKGSVCAMLASVLEEAGLKVGLYTSPHLSDVRERISVGGRRIPPRRFARWMGRALKHEGKDRLTYFELLTSVAFLHFRESRVDAAVLETGLGGRFDATNVVRRPLAAVVATVDYDHMDFLGPTLESIAREKAGVFKRGRPALCGEAKPAPLGVLRSRAAAVGARFKALPRRPAWRAARVDWVRGRQLLRGPGGRRLAVGLLGEAQARNAALALETVEALRSGGLDVPWRAVERGLARVRWPARFEVLRLGGRTLILDGAHNAEAVRNFRRTLEASPWGRAPKLFILGMLRDKRHEKMVRILAPLLKRVIACRPPSPRALEPGRLAREVARWAPGARVSVISDPAEAFAWWKRRRREPAVAAACGSFYLAGAVRRAALGG